MDAVQPGDNPVESTTVVIGGGGPAGIMAVLPLARAGIAVTVAASGVACTALAGADTRAPDRRRPPTRARASVRSALNPVGQGHRPQRADFNAEKTDSLSNIRVARCSAGLGRHARHAATFLNGADSAFRAVSDRPGRCRPSGRPSWRVR